MLEVVSHAEPRFERLAKALSLTARRYLVAVVLVLIGLVWIGQGLGYIAGSGMSGQPIFAMIGAGLVVGGAALAWWTRRSAPW